MVVAPDDVSADHAGLFLVAGVVSAVRPGPDPAVLARAQVGAEVGR